MQKFDILTFGSITLDILIQIPDKGVVTIDDNPEFPHLNIPLGDKIKFDNSESLCGGGAANSAVGFAKLGLNTGIFGVMGDKSNRGFLISELQKNNVNTDYITFADNSASSFSVILNTWSGERTVFHHRTMCENFNKETLLKAPDSRAIYIGHLYHGPDEMLMAIPEWKAKHQGIIGWNPGKTQFKRGLNYFKNICPSIDILILNVEEAELFTEKKSKKISWKECNKTITGTKISRNINEKISFFNDVREIARLLQNTGIEQIVITDGGRGAQIFAENEHYWVPSQQVPKVDTLGAGDAFSVGILAAKLHNKDLKTQILWGSENSTGVIQKLGAQAGQKTLKELDAI
jgi:ribokinase